MARNRKHQSGAVRFVPALKTFLLCLLLGGSAAGYVLQKNAIYELGKQIREKEAILERVKWENKVRANQLAHLQSPNWIADRVKTKNLGLQAPQTTQLIWLPEPGVKSEKPQLFVLGN